MDALTQHVTLVRTEAEGLQDYLEPLSSASWHHPSACVGREVIVHGGLNVAAGNGTYSYCAYAARVIDAISHSCQTCAA